MSLISFHRFLIVTAIAFCAGFSAWEARAYLSFDAGSTALLLAVTFGLFAVGLSVYLVRLPSILRLRD